MLGRSDFFFCFRSFCVESRQSRALRCLGYSQDTVRSLCESFLFYYGYIFIVLLYCYLAICLLSLRERCANREFQNIL